MVIKTRGRECHWHLEGREQGCYSTFYKAQDSSPQQRRTLPKISARQKKPGWGCTEDLQVSSSAAPSCTGQGEQEHSGSQVRGPQEDTEES